MSLPREPYREEIAKIEIGHTDVRRGTVALLVAAFVIAIAAGPLVEGGWAARAPADAVMAWWHPAQLPVAVRTTFAAERRTGAGRFAAVVGANGEALRLLAAFEDAVGEEARLSRRLRPFVQQELTGWLGVGNEQAYVGRGGWLFFRPDVDYLTGPGFLTPSRLAARARAASAWTEPPQPDPRAAILRFHRQLDARGITLLVLPTPVKPMLHPERLVATVGVEEVPLQNPSYAGFVEDLERAGVLVLDLATELAAARGTGRRSAYLATDTHWRPEVVEAVAERLAGVIAERVRRPPGSGGGYRVEPTDIVGRGDIAAMLDLPVGQTRYPDERVRIRRIVDAAGAPWRASRTGDVLLLGDSFSNIYSLGSMGWGDSAGLAEQLSFALDRPIDRIVQNDAGAFATRALLRRGIGAGRDRLEGKRVVVYQFAVRELAVGDWRLIDVPAPAP